MFYSHEVLTSRKYGVATVWLVATLGAKSSLRKLSRKSILDVDVARACNSIVAPDAPMALRLQSNLLYGVARVYSHQCGYVLSDAETAKNSIRLMLQTMRSGILDAATPNHGRADQLILQDDPNFLPDLDLIPPGLEHLGINKTTLVELQDSAFSPYASLHPTPHASNSLGRVVSPHGVGELLLPPSADSSGGISRNYLHRTSSPGEPGNRSRAISLQLLDDDLGLIVQDDGNIVIGNEIVEQSPNLAMDMVSIPADSQPPAPERGQTKSFGSFRAPSRADDDDCIVPQNDDFQFYGTEELPAQQVESQPLVDPAAIQMHLKSRAERKGKVLSLDPAIELRNGDLARWDAEYRQNMSEALRVKSMYTTFNQAKINAKIWMLGQQVKGNSHPLSQFTGAQILEALTGLQLRGQKRQRDVSSDRENERRVRSRTVTPPAEAARYLEEDIYFPDAYDDAIEYGREAPTPLDDHRQSSIMPWNRSGGSFHPGPAFPPSASLRGAGGSQASALRRRGSRFTSASPLLGHGGFSDTGGYLPTGLGSQGDVGMTEFDVTHEFELFGPGAYIDTPTAAQSQWQRAALDGESKHFLKFVKSTIVSLGPQHDQDSQVEAYQDTHSIVFEQLLPPENHGRIVAAQALMHVLSLATKNFLTAHQPKSFGPIEIQPIGSPNASVSQSEDGDVENEDVVIS